MKVDATAIEISYPWARMRAQDDEGLAWNANARDDQGDTIIRLHDPYALGFGLSRRYGQMGVNAAEDRERVTVHTMHPVLGRGPVFYASLPRDTDTPKAQGTHGEEARRRLVSILWDHLLAMDSPLRTFCLSSDRAAFPAHVIRDPLGKPRLLVGGHRGPAISFSEGGGNVWAAVCGDDSDIGIDVAEASEFQGGYPFHRVFNAHELHHVLHLAGGDLAKAAALLWSVKEAAVKALGCAFHFVDPLHIHVCPSPGGDEGYLFPVRLSGKALARFPAGARLSLWVRSFPEGTMWLSIAVVNRPIDTAMGEPMPCPRPRFAATREMPDGRPLPDRHLYGPAKGNIRDA